MAQPPAPLPPSHPWPQPPAPPASHAHSVYGTGLHGGLQGLHGHLCPIQFWGPRPSLCSPAGQGLVREARTLAMAFVVSSALGREGGGGGEGHRRGATFRRPPGSGAGPQDTCPVPPPPFPPVSAAPSLPRCQAGTQMTKAPAGASEYEELGCEDAGHLPLSSGAARCPQVTKGDLPPTPAPGPTTPS